MYNLDRIAAAISQLQDDIKAEAIIADIIENGVSPEDIVTVPDGLFKRRFNQDISNAEVKRLNNDQKVLELHITRDGIYDALPAGLFHEHTTESVTKGQDMAKESKKQRLIEAQARKFFLPFENEIFHKLVDLELEERKILNRYSENLFNDVFSGFWKLDRSLPQRLLSRLVILLPIAHKITGNLEMTARSLEIIIDEQVKVSLIRSEQPGKAESQIAGQLSSLGAAALGLDFVCGLQNDTAHSVLDFTIGPLRNSSVEDYLENGQISKFLDCFFEYFVPVELGTRTTIEIYNEEHEFTLDPELLPILGYNSSI